MALYLKAKLPIPARVVVGIDVVELKGRLAVNLDNGFSASHGVVVHVGIEKSKATGRERGHFVELPDCFHFCTSLKCKALEGGRQYAQLDYLC